MRTYIYKELIAEAFTSMGKNNINHPDIVKAFGIDRTGHYCEIYTENWGYSVHLYGKGFMNGYCPTIIDITEQKDIKDLRTKIKTVFSSNGVMQRSEPLICDTCKSGLIDYPDINRRTCRCGRLGYNVTD